MSRLVRVYSRYPQRGSDGLRWREGDPLLENREDIVLPIHKVWSTCVYEVDGVLWSEEQSTLVERGEGGMPYLLTSHWAKEDVNGSDNKMKGRFWNHTRKVYPRDNYVHPLHRAAQHYWFNNLNTSLPQSVSLPQLYVRKTGAWSEYASDKEITLMTVWAALHGNRLPATPHALRSLVEGIVSDKADTLRESTVAGLTEILWGGKHDVQVCECSRLAKEWWDSIGLAPDWAIDREQLVHLHPKNMVVMISNTISDSVVPSSLNSYDSVARIAEPGVIEVGIGSRSKVCRQVQIHTNSWMPFTGSRLNIQLTTNEGS